ncbi:hypothetical protein HUU62_23120 [Rhodoferax sp. 4810]|uniref:Uncharacterized protein n=1 Tax=Thiospirillum jenense TaxID=1653858 RepID=A0A839HJY1_9GAMM|nr:hypothetical protein [Thiospirillum jenense]MBB1077301.1 hypothetical protein [Rhodoferax jenense]MBB1127068.1 hypothetical protein [Thiospirillum jenense]
MNEKEAKRLAKLRDDDYLPKKLIYTDLLLLLQYDADIRAAVRAIVSSQDDNQAQLTLQPTLAKQGELMRNIPPMKSHSSPLATKPDPLREQLKSELTLLTQVKNDADLAAWWRVNTNDNEGRQLLQLVALAAQWDQVLQLWERLAARCKENQRPATAIERAILSGAVQIHNLIWRDKQAELQSVTIGTPFDYKNHERGAAKGEVIRDEWLPGLRNAAGDLQKKPLVAT